MCMEKSKKLEQRLEVILKMWVDHTLAEIGKELGISRQAVSQLVHKLRKNGLDIPPKRTPKFDWKKFVDEHKDKVEAITKL